MSQPATGAERVWVPWTRLLGPLLSWRLPVRVLERNVLAYRRSWLIFVAGFLEPLLFLLAIGIGVGELAGDVTGPSGQPISYRLFVAPGLLAISAMNGVVFDATFNFFFKFKYAHTYDAMLATPVGVRDVTRGELSWTLVRSGIYATGLLVTMLALGLVESWWAVLAVPAALLIGFGFAGVGFAATTFMRSFVDFDFINVAILPLFLFSGTFFPLSQYPGVLEAIVRITPLYQGVAIERALVLGDLDWTLLLHAAYLAAMGVIGMRVATRRMSRLLQP